MAKIDAPESWSTTVKVPVRTDDMMERRSSGQNVPHHDMMEAVVRRQAVVRDVLSRLERARERRRAGEKDAVERLLWVDHVEQSAPYDLQKWSPPFFSASEDSGGPEPELPTPQQTIDTVLEASTTRPQHDAARRRTGRAASMEEQFVPDRDDSHRSSSSLRGDSLGASRPSETRSFGATPDSLVDLRGDSEGDSLVETETGSSEGRLPPALRGDSLVETETGSLRLDEGVAPQIVREKRPMTRPALQEEVLEEWVNEDLRPPGGGLGGGLGGVGPPSRSGGAGGRLGGVAASALSPGQVREWKERLFMEILSSARADHDSREGGGGAASAGLGESDGGRSEEGL